jgi:hypothetical protein
MKKLNQTMHHRKLLSLVSIMTVFGACGQNSEGGGRNGDNNKKNGKNIEPPLKAFQGVTNNMTFDEYRANAETLIKNQLSAVNFMNGPEEDADAIESPSGEEEETTGEGNPFSEEEEEATEEGDQDDFLLIIDNTLKHARNKDCTRSFDRFQSAFTHFHEFTSYGLSVSVGTVKSINVPISGIEKKLIKTKDHAFAYQIRRLKSTGTLTETSSQSFGGGDRNTNKIYFVTEAQASSAPDENKFSSIWQSQTQIVSDIGKQFTQFDSNIQIQSNFDGEKENSSTKIKATFQGGPNPSSTYHFWSKNGNYYSTTYLSLKRIDKDNLKMEFSVDQNNVDMKRKEKGTIFITGSKKNCKVAVNSDLAGS